MTSARVDVALPAPLELNSYQERVALVPEEFDLALLGSRGPGKTFALVALAIRHATQHAAFARILVLRQSFPGLVDVTATLLGILPRAFEGASYNSQTHLWRIPNGATVELGILETEADLVRFQGRNFSLILVDEATEWPDFALVDKLRACLRAPAGVPCRLVLSGNPGGVGHAGIFRRFVAGRDPWTAYTDERTGSLFVTCPGNFRDNRFLDVERYERQLRAATAGDAELGRAWLEGDWNVQRGAFFTFAEQRVALDSTVWSPEAWSAFAKTQRHSFDWRSSESQEPWRPELFLAYDHGVAAPAVALLCWRSDGRTGLDGNVYPVGSLLVLDEWSSAEPDDWSRGRGHVVSEVASELKALAQRWGMRGCRGPADDALWNRTGSDTPSIADEFARNGVHFERANKRDRASGWSAMREQLDAASTGAVDRPGLHVSHRCAGWWQTVPAVPRDPRRPEDLDTRAADHWADATRYALTGGGPTASSMSTVHLFGV